MMVRLTIDGQMVWVARQTPLLKAARNLGLNIPTLCHHEALKPYGVCRLCLVEVRANGRSRLVTACNFPAEAGLEVRTASAQVRRARRMVLELLLARCPEVPLVRELAEAMGIRTSRFKNKSGERCLLCGLCVRVCEEIVGARAVGFVSRGAEREVNTPFALPSRVCLGCGACTFVCPTGCLEMVEDPEGSGGRSLRRPDPALEPCPHEYDCQTCEVDRRFLQETRRVLEGVRRKPA